VKIEREGTEKGQCGDERDTTKTGKREHTSVHQPSESPPMKFCEEVREKGEFFEARI